MMPSFLGMNGTAVVGYACWGTGMTTIFSSVALRQASGYWLLRGERFVRTGSRERHPDGRGNAAQVLIERGERQLLTLPPGQR
jgi:hypothetical protein